MRNTREAVKYGIDTLKVTPEEFFSLIESSNGYEGDDYKRWLANEIIKIAEKDGVGYSQLLVKKFSIIQSLTEEYEAVIKEDWLNKLRDMVNSDSMYSVDFSYFGKPIEDVDWFNGVDYDEVNSFFVNEELPDEVSEKIQNNEDISIITRLSNKPANKGSDMFKGAKDYNIVCKNEGSLMLYRMCSMIEAFNSGKNFKFCFFTNADFLTDSENADIIKYFLNYFKYEGIIVKSSELLSDTYISSRFAFVVCTPRLADESTQDGFVLREVELKDNELKTLNTRRYSRSSRSMLKEIVSNAPKMVDFVKKKKKGAIIKEPLVKGLKDALGYLNIGVSQDVWLTCHPDKSAKQYVPITKDNLDSVIVYFAVTNSLSNFGFSNGISEIVTGNAEYNSLLYNCVPLFLFDVDSKFCDYGTIRSNGEIIRLVSNFDVECSDIVDSLLEKGEIYFSVEAKELLNICKGFLDYLKNDMKQSIVGLTFKDVRVEANHSDLNEAYITALTNLKDYIKTLYRKME